MERVVAIKKLGKILGKSLRYRIDHKAPGADERKAAQQQVPALVAARQQAEKAVSDRRQAILDADPEYQELVAAHKEARARADQASSIARHFKITVGTTPGGLFFHIKAQGDSWEDVIETLSRKAA